MLVSERLTTSFTVCRIPSDLPVLAVIIAFRSSIRRKPLSGKLCIQGVYSTSCEATRK